MCTVPSNKQRLVDDQGTGRNSWKKWFQCIPRLKWNATVIKIGKSQPSMQAVLQVFSKPPKILPARGLRLNKKVQNLNVFMKKVKCGANYGKNWAKLTKYASCTSSR